MHSTRERIVISWLQINPSTLISEEAEAFLNFLLSLYNQKQLFSDREFKLLNKWIVRCFFWSRDSVKDLLRCQGSRTQKIWGSSGLKGYSYLQLKLNLEHAPPQRPFTARSSSLRKASVNRRPDAEAKCLRTRLCWYSLPGILVALGDYEIIPLTSVFLGHTLHSIFHSTVEQSGIGTAMHLAKRNTEPVLSTCLASEPPVISNHWNQVASSPAPVRSLSQEQLWASIDTDCHPPPAWQQRKSPLKIVGGQWEQCVSPASTQFFKSSHWAVLEVFLWITSGSNHR